MVNQLFVETPEGAHLRGTRWTVSRLEGATLAAYLRWRDERRLAASLKTAKKLQASLRLREQGILSPTQLGLGDDFDRHLLDQVIRQQGGWRGAMRGYQSLGEGSYWRTRRFGS